MNAQLQQLINISMSAKNTDVTQKTGRLFKVELSSLGGASVW